MQPSDLRPFTVNVQDLDAADYFFGRNRSNVIRDLRTKLDADGVNYKFNLYGYDGTIIIIDGEDITGEDLESSSEYQYLASIL